MKSFVVALAVLLSGPAFAQVVNRPTDPPIVSAENESWYRLGEPITFAGDVYYRAGPVVFFDGAVMVRTGHYNGVPLYADTTLEPYSVVFVPIGRGLVQPYERLRGGELAGTSGSRTSSFPGRSAGARGIPAAPGAPTNAPLPIGAISVFTPESGVVPTTGAIVPAPPVVASVPTPRRMSVAERARSVQKSREAISIEFRGSRWVSAGAAIRPQPNELAQIGDYNGFPVYAKKGEDEPIYLPSAQGLVAPFTKRR